MPVLQQRPSFGVHELRSDVWHAHALAGAARPVLATGDAALDAQLPGGGWPLGALVEILQAAGTHNEWRLLLRALACSGSGTVVLVGAAHTPFAPALAACGLQPRRLLWMLPRDVSQRLWSAEQALRCADVDAVLLWLGDAPARAVGSGQLRRLQMAAAEHGKLLVAMRANSERQEASPAVLRLEIGVQPAAAAPADDVLQVDILKRRGPVLAQALGLRARSAPMRTMLALATSAGAGAGRGAHAGGRDALDRIASTG